jgi:two-component system OmpR family response regulator
MKTSSELSVFLVDDDKLFLTSLTHQLKTMFKSKTKIMAFTTGEECLKHLEERPDIIILDYYLNSKFKDAMNGLEILKKIVHANPESKVIMLSAQEKMEVAVDAIKHGAYDYIIKNDNVYLRTKLSIINAAGAISITKELKNFKFLIRVVLALIILIIGGCILLQIYYPELSGITH